MFFTRYPSKNRNPMKHVPALLACLFISPAAMACITCNKAIQDAIFNSTFFPNLGTMLSAFFVLAAVVAALVWWGARSHARRVAQAGRQEALNPVPLLTASIILGIGLGGFADGIVLHQILQWHNMLSAKLTPDTAVNKAVNMFWDGVFHFFTLLVTVVGVVRLWRAGQGTGHAKNGWLLAGGLSTGWGLFNLIEGIIDHGLLKLHNVREQAADPSAWNQGFLVFAVALIVAGGAAVRRGQRLGARA